ncbi:hypothetical protein [Achromobacter xylosoxidans]|uniref:Uncharacterized protein n=1 Tax=Achromobacter phage JWX TaxID=1589746 RepID=A0A0B4ZZF3_9CAUD|nr:hypothetical protein [Achromobacter xylosoxidans]YP_009196190.1 hypothetical protein AVV28_gp05 [Achromobacter phage JWX]YP_009196251.1 hypothetical protein AVV28_gp50 [Achromobacter phage JWX]WLW38426.1 hypothetical protein JWT_00002 [Achromobacter phage JWT]AJD82771.1 hypothetical protein JWX_00005 [Achromobacter phage JWX]AJD82832.1 hypothetical protein JWX_00067 [Achromobacter phage JWX]
MELVIGFGTTFDADGNMLETEALGFRDVESDIFIIDPFTSDCGRFGFTLQQAMESYNLTREEVLRIVEHNSQLNVFESNPRYTLEEIRNMCGL